MEFNCIGCAECCRKVGLLLDNRDKIDGPWKPLLDEFPYRATITGSCEMLNEETLQCMVYNDRPMICRVKDIKEILEPETPIDVWYKEQETHCRKLMVDAGWTTKKINKEYAKAKKDRRAKSVPQDTR